MKAMERLIPTSEFKPEPPAVVVIYSDVKTHEEITSSNPEPIDFGKSDIAVLYRDLKIAPVRIAPIIGVRTPKTVRSRLKNLGVEMRPSIADPELERRRTLAHQEVYMNKQRVTEISKRIHTPVRNAKTSQAMLDRYATDPVFREGRAQGLVLAQEALLKLRSARKEEKERVETEKRAEFMNLIFNSPNFGTLTSRQQEVLRLRYRAESGKRLTFEEIGEILGGIRGSVAQAHEASALRKLGIAKNK